MAATNADKLLGVISTAINAEYPDVPPDEVAFEEKATALRLSLAALYPVTDEEFSEMKRKLKSNIVVKPDFGVLIKDGKKHTPWLAPRRAELDFFFWNRYVKYLEEVKHWNPRVTGNLGLDSDIIVDYLGDPASDEAFQRRGLVLGDVQSGKTANYTAICNKAADTGYRVIIILAGTMENLRRQTQERLDAEFSGRMSQYLLDPKQDIGNVPVGVGKYGQEKRIETFTSVTKDFDKNILRALNLSLHSVTSTVLFVVKKNKSILNNLIKWLRSSNTDARGAINLPMLLIDDEADNASVNTKKEDEDPTAINDAIRRLLKLFRQTSYLGITATPYANIFINPEDEREMQGDDLFPRDFIYSLGSPTNYIGASKIFGENASFSDSLEALHPEEMDAFFPYNHQKGLVVDELPPSMKEAIAYFLFVNGIRDFRGDTAEHRSMMIHVSRFTDVQNQISGLVHRWVEDICSDLQNYSRLSETESDSIPNISFLKSVWLKHKLLDKIAPTDNRMTWHRFLSERMLKAVAPVVVRPVNQKNSATGLDYYSHKGEGLRVIAIGGNSLSRGFTLEGLCVSYFYRRSQMYDTLLQMGRWFGYRPGYDDLFKIWISTDAIDWYGYITAAAEELKLEISRMRDANKTPMEFGLKVRQDPASLIVTARNKMRTATFVKRPISVSGRLLETPRLRADISSLRQNEDVFKDFVKRLPEVGEKVEKEGARYFWQNVSKDEIEQLLRDFKTHPWHLNFQGAALADFISTSAGIDNWDVFIAEGSANEYNGFACGNELITVKPEKRTVKATKEQISISGTKVRVGTGGAAKIGLSTDQRKTAEKIFDEEYKKTHTTIPDKMNYPDSAYLEIDRPPVLILHVVSVDRGGKDKNDKLRSQIDEGVQVPDYLFALGIGIPANGDERIAYYMVNMVEFRSYYDAEEDDDE
jgi:hypothetical protein